MLMKTFRNSNLEACPNACVVGTWRWERSHGDSHLEGDVFCMGTFRTALYLTIIYLCNYAFLTKRHVKVAIVNQLYPSKATNKSNVHGWMKIKSSKDDIWYLFAFCNSNFVCNSKFKHFKPASIFVVYLDDHCWAQELSAHLSGTCKMEEIFHGGSTCPLKIRASFY
jgi:hypothetical protein